MASLPSVPVRDSDGFGFDTQRLERIISNYERQTDGIRELQKQAFWASVFQIFFVLADDVLFFVRRSPTIWAFEILLSVCCQAFIVERA